MLLSFGTMDRLGQHRIMVQGDLARDFDPAESSGNAGILCVFPYVPLNEKSTSCPLQGVHLHFQVSFCIPISVIFKNGHWGYLYAISHI